MLPTQGLQRCLGRAVVVREGAAISLSGGGRSLKKAYLYLPGTQNIHFKMVGFSGGLQITACKMGKNCKFGGVQERFFLREIHRVLSVSEPLNMIFLSQKKKQQGSKPTKKVQQHS